MLKQLRIQLTLLCSLITGSILLIMAVIMLYTFEKTLNERNYAYFKNAHNSIVEYIRTGKIISQIWLAQIEAANEMIVSIEDNGNPFLFKGSWKSKTDRQILLNTAKNLAINKYNFDIYKSYDSFINVNNIFFDFKGEKNEAYNASITVLPSEQNNYLLILIHDKQYESKKIGNNRLLFFSLVLEGIILLAIFSWWFAGKAIIPIEMSRKKQVEFVAAASHELKAPLAVITTSTSALQNQTPSEQERFIVAVQKECKRMARLVDDLLLLSNADAKTWSIKSEEVEMDTILIETIDLFFSLANSQKQKLELILPENIVPKIYGDAERISQAISIFMDNALHYTPNGGKITVVLNIEQNHMNIKVEDNGIGISDENKKYIFDRFYRADKSHNEKDHYGLGLSIANEIICLHKGSISISDTIGGGVTFTIKIPLLN